jgi:hypothetical protein
MVQKEDNQLSNETDRLFRKLYWGILVFLLIQIFIYYQLTQSLQ